MMSKLILYEQKFYKSTKYKGDVYPLMSAHQLADYWKVSIRVARHKISKLLKSGELKLWKH